MAERKLHQLTVDELTFRISSLLLQDPVLQSVVVKGELAELKKHTSGHVYFTLLGGESRISCALFRNYIPYVPQWPRNGDEVLAEGAVSLYPPGGRTSLLSVVCAPREGSGGKGTARAGAAAGSGRAFDVRLKRPIPAFPEKVAVVTPPHGGRSGMYWPWRERGCLPALLWSFRPRCRDTRPPVRSAPLSRTPAGWKGRRWPSWSGAEAAGTTTLTTSGWSGRGQKLPLPIVTGVGHEIDETLSDKAADVRAATLVGSGGTGLSRFGRHPGLPSTRRTACSGRPWTGTSGPLKKIWPPIRTGEGPWRNGRSPSGFPALTCSPPGSGLREQGPWPLPGNGLLLSVRP